MKVTFKCKRSGNTVSFTNENDIKHLRAQEGYVEVKDETKTTEEASKGNVDNPNEGKNVNEADGKNVKNGEVRKEVREVLKKRGRPARK